MVILHPSCPFFSLLSPTGKGKSCKYRYSRAEAKRFDKCWNQKRRKTWANVHKKLTKRVETRLSAARGQTNAHRGANLRHALQSPSPRSMAALVCALSGEVPVEPVISLKSGTLFEKRLIEAYVGDNGMCPITREPLSLQDLVPLQGGKAVKPRSAAHTSLQGMMGAFQSEWDAMVFETFKLRELLNEARMELSHTLYQHDAACRYGNHYACTVFSCLKNPFFIACKKCAGTHAAVIPIQSDSQAHEGKGRGARSIGACSCQSCKHGPSRCCFCGIFRAADGRGFFWSGCRNFRDSQGV
jgi:hypothetical protein